MISDLIHDSSDIAIINGDLIVFDTLIIFSIAMLSVFYGFLSLKIMFNLFMVRFNLKFAYLAIGFSFLLSCLGFYMGRVIRAETHAGNLYSWDFFLHPIKTIDLVISHLFPISTHHSAYLMMILFGIIYFFFVL